MAVESLDLTKMNYSVAELNSLPREEQLRAVIKNPELVLKIADPTAEELKAVILEQPKIIDRLADEIQSLEDLEASVISTWLNLVEQELAENPNGRIAELYNKHDAAHPLTSVTQATKHEYNLQALSQTVPAHA